MTGIALDRALYLLHYDAAHKQYSCEPGASRNARFNKTNTIMVYGVHRSAKLLLAQLCGLLCLLVQVPPSVNALPLQLRGTSTLCGAKMRPSGIRTLCAQAGTIWHFNANRKFGEIGFDEKTNKSGLQCGELPLDFQKQKSRNCSRADFFSLSVLPLPS